MVKGISRRVIVVESPDPHIFEQAIFILSNDAAGGGVSSQQVVEQAVRIAKSYARTHGAPPRRRRLTTWMAALLGGGVIGLLAAGAGPRLRDGIFDALSIFLLTWGGQLTVRLPFLPCSSAPEYKKLRWDTPSVPPEQTSYSSPKRRISCATGW